MAQRRMFSKSVVRTDSFLEMPQTAQNLYFHLGMEPDDDGFVTPKMIMRTLGSTEDDLKILIVKGFVIQFESGVIVVRHWKENNYLRNDRYKETIYKTEKKLLKEKNNMYYLGIPSGYQRDTQVRLGKVRLGKDNITASTAVGIDGVKKKHPTHQLTDYYLKLKGIDYEDSEFYKEQGISYSHLAKRAKEILDLTNGNLDEAKSKVEKVSKWANFNGLEWTLETVQKRWLEIDLLKS